ncbi:22673_t:CDS:2, partial [Dentiscutata erythropus]
EKLRNYTTTNEQPKPVVVLISDSGPNENPRYRKTIQMMIEHFDKYNLDTIIVVCFAPHQSASNLVERQMVPLSHDLAGVILPHDTFGSHLDAQLKTNDEELEKRNFKAAADILTSIWEDTIIDNYPVLVKYIDPPNEHYSPSKKTLKNHTRKCLRKESNLSVEAALNTQEFPVVYVHNYHHGEFLVSNESSKTIWVEEEAVPEDVLETYNQQVQVQEELVADK